MIAVTAGSAALFAAGIVVFEVAAWALVQGLWKLTTWYHTTKVVSNVQEEEVLDAG